MRRAFVACADLAGTGGGVYVFSRRTRDASPCSTRILREASLEAPRLERRLIAILAADVEGYSRHMERDEVSTLATLTNHRSIVDDLIASHNGRITGTAGDSVLACRPAFRDGPRH
jgi:class 3 adenylate cyclase